MNRKQKPHFWQEPRFRAGSLSTLLLCAALAAIVSLNLLFTALEKKNAWRIDYSFNALATYGEVTAEVLDSLPHPVHIYALYSRGSEDQPLLELLDRYAAASPLVTWEQADISLNPGLLARFQTDSTQGALNNNSLIVYCEETGRWRTLSSLDFISLSYNYDQGAYEYAGLTYESSLTSAISSVTQETVPRIMILQGHGELDENGTAALANLLSTNHYDVYYFTLNTTETELAPGDLLVMLSPVRDLTDAELAKITAFTEAGGSVLLTCDYSDPAESMPNYSALLRSYGFMPKKGVTVAASSEPATCYNNNRTCIIPRMQNTDITQDLVSGGDTFLYLAGSRAFAMPESADRYLETTAVLTTTENAYLRDFTAGSISLSQQEGDESGPFALALQARRMSASGDISRAFILGCSTLLTSSEEYSMTVAQELIIRTVEFLLGQSASNLHIMARTAVRPGLAAASVTLGSVIIVLLPLMVLGTAILVLVWRKHK